MLLCKVDHDLGALPVGQQICDLDKPAAILAEGDGFPFAVFKPLRGIGLAVGNLVTGVVFDRQGDLRKRSAVLLLLCFENKALDLCDASFVDF